MNVPTVKRLPSGYWHVRWGPNQWMQWRVGREPQPADIFGWPFDSQFDEAKAAVERWVREVETEDVT